MIVDLFFAMELILILFSFIVYLKEGNLLHKYLINLQMLLYIVVGFI